MKRLIGLALSLTMGGCGCEFASSFFGNVGSVKVRDSGIDTAIGSCGEPWTEMYSPPEINGPWSEGPIGEFGVIHRLLDAGVKVREVLLTVDGRQWTARDIFSKMQVAVLGRDGTLCGTAFDDAGYPHLRLEFLDGGVADPQTSGNCWAYENGWWVTWADRQVLRGRGNAIESLGNLDSGIIPGVIDPGVIPAVGPVSADGDVVIFVSYHQPGGWILPSRLQLKGPEGLGAAAPIGLIGRNAYGFNFGPFPRYPYMWDEQGTPSRMSLGDGSVPFVQMASLHGHSDGHLCGAIETAGASDYSVAFWKRDGGFVAPGILRALGLEIDPVECWPVGRDWYHVVYFPDASRTPRVALIRLQLDCLRD